MTQTDSGHEDKRQRAGGLWVGGKQIRQWRLSCEWAVLGNKSRSGFNLSISAGGQEETGKVVTILINLPRQCACDLGAFIVLDLSTVWRRTRP